VLQRFFGKHSFLIVEDVEQHGCVRYAQKFSTDPLPNMLAFMPLPSISGATNMFKAQKNSRLLLLQIPEYYQRAFASCPEWVLDIYTEAISLAGNQSNLTRSIAELSDYFK
ncbi:MAG: hypothetical protein ACRD4B_06855, partial [Acidobacteriota bacterium]